MYTLTYLIKIAGYWRAVTLRHPDQQFLQQIARESGLTYYTIEEP